MKRSVHHALAKVVPDGIKDRIYYKYQMVRSNRNHQKPEVRLERRENAPNHVLIVVIDALRPDFIPEIGCEFSHAIAPAPWTYPSVTSIHTGLWPSDHGSVAHTHPDDEYFAMPQQTDRRASFPYDLEAAGYSTYAGCAFATPFLALQSWYQTHSCYRDAAAEVVISDYQEWRGQRQNTVGYLHLGDLHAPVSAPDEYIEKWEVDTELEDLANISKYKTDFNENNSQHQYYRQQKIRLHRAALEYVSNHLSALLAQIRDDTLVVVTGDHGEALWEHQRLDRQITDSRPNYCFGHGGTPFDTIARVPLTVMDPRGSLFPEGGWASLRDIPASVISSAVAGREVPGHDWHTRIPDDRTVLCEGTRYGVERKAVYSGDYKLIRSNSDNVTLTAKVSEDGEEFGDIPEQVFQRLSDALPATWDDMDSGTSVSATTEQQLRALGYR